MVVSQKLVAKRMQKKQLKLDKGRKVFSAAVVTKKIKIIYVQTT